MLDAFIPIQFTVMSAKIEGEAKMDAQSLSRTDTVTDQSVAFGAMMAGGDHYARLLQPECLLPVQYNALIRKPLTEQGESRLLLAVLKDALRSYLKNMSGRTARARREFEEICHWFFAEDQEGIFAFESLCEALGIGPEPLRRWLRGLPNGDGQAQRRRLVGVKPAGRC